MCKIRVINEERNFKREMGMFERVSSNLIAAAETFKERLVLSVLAEEGSNAEPIEKPEDKKTGDDKTKDSKSTDQKVDVLALVEKARKEEKDKLYNTLEGKNDEIAKLKETTMEDKKTITSLQARIDELEGDLKTATKDDGELVQTLRANADDMKTDIHKLEKEVLSLKEELANKEEKHKLELEDIQNKSSLSEYRMKRIYEEGIDNVIPELITGANEEEIETAIKLSKERVETIKQSLVDKNGQPSARQTNDKQFNIPKAGKPKGNNGGNDVFKFEDLAKLDPMSEEYQKAREMFFGRPRF